ncbi:MAG: aminopeptidase P family protein [Bacteroidales bacterium]|jgi:Xaa-Pro aminopeptidase|nr:aminopeptidase P family protein [Bacteroidales bacterium]HOL98712.1 aminopeptidase P family protein [Bacteroidales bacterium]HOM36980.1 aminopeptidase P family protein [Bacteroidales bacterium]HPD24597.1 aminopeptidase P family protein [Bacteroidales bacterium]HRT00379.1 aminopeptidase P family protein [Bacteroidales bacterium]
MGFQKEFFINNRNRLSSIIEPNSMVLFFSAETFPRTGDQTFKYRQNSDTFYFSGLTQPETCFFIQTDNSKHIVYEHAFIIEPTDYIIIWTGSKYSKSDVSEISGIERVSFLNEFDSVLEERIKCSENIYFSFKNNVRGIKYSYSKVNQYIEKIKSLYPEKIILDADPQFMELRLCKTDEELNKIKKAIEITGNCFNEIRKFLKPGIYEYEIEALIYKEFISNGANDVAYLPIVASGKNNCILHYIDNRNICNKGDLLLLDFGAEYDYYAADLTRTIPVSGKLSQRQADIYASVLKVQRMMIPMMKPGITINELNSKCEELIQEELLNLGLLSVNDIKNQTQNAPAFKKYFMHGLSHFLGLDVHDVGNKDVVLKPGMVLTCEPAIYIREEEFGIRLENDILITDDEPVDLCKNIPIEIADIEK